MKPWNINDIDAQLPQPRRYEDPRPVRPRDLALVAIVVVLVVIGTLGAGS